MALIDYLKIMRPMNGFMVIMMAISGIWFATDFNTEWYYYILTIIVALTYMSIANVHNDIIDLEIDKINAPHRPIPSGKITLSQAKKFTIFLFISGTVAGLFLTYQAIIIMAITLILSLLYNRYLKKTGFIGNITVGVTATSAFLYGDAVANGFDDFWPPEKWNASVYLFWISALLNTAREVSKGIMDVPGDEAHGIRTIAVKYGKKTAALVVTLLITAAMIFASIPIFQAVFTLRFIIAVGVFIVLILQVHIPLLKNPNYETAKLFKKRIILVMLLALIIILADISIERYLSW